MQDFCNLAVQSPLQYENHSLHKVLVVKGLGEIGVYYFVHNMATTYSNSIMYTIGLSTVQAIVHYHIMQMDMVALNLSVRNSLFLDLQLK